MKNKVVKNLGRKQVQPKP